MASIHIEALNCDMAPQACSVLAQAFVTNPLNIAAFGPSQLAKNEAFFRVGLAAMKGTKLVATDGPKILGLIHWVPFPDCQFPWFEKLRMVPATVKGFGLGSALRVGSWLSTWSKHDPSTAHSHLGPIGVLPAVQGQHIGLRLMEEYCKELDRTREAGYLETDRPENVNFYRRFGFEVTDDVIVLGVPNYLMWRKPKSQTAQSTTQ